MLDHTCIQEINSSWSWCMITLTCCWICLASTLLRIFASEFFFVYIVLVSLWCHGDLSSLCLFPQFLSLSLSCVCEPVYKWISLCMCRSHWLILGVFFYCSLLLIIEAGSLTWSLPVQLDCVASETRKDSKCLTPCTIIYLGSGWLNSSHPLGLISFSTVLFLNMCLDS